MVAFLSLFENIRIMDKGSMNMSNVLLIFYWDAYLIARNTHNEREMHILRILK